MVKSLGVFYSPQNSLSLGFLLCKPTMLQGQEDIVWVRCFWVLELLPFARVVVGPEEWCRFGIRSLCTHPSRQVLCGNSPGSAGPPEPGEQECGHRQGCEVFS